MNPQPLPILTNVAMAVAAAQSTGTLLLVVIETDASSTANDVHLAASSFASHALPPLTLRIAAQSHEHTLFAQVYGQPSSVPCVYLLRQGRVLDTLDGAAALDSALVKARITQALGIDDSTPEPVIATPTAPLQASSSSSSSASASKAKPSQPATCSASASAAITPAPTPPPAKPRTAPAPTPSVPAPKPTPTTTAPVDPDSIALAIRHLDASVSRHTFSLTSTTLATLADLLSSEPYNHADHGLMQSYPTRISLYTSSSALDPSTRDTTLAACGLLGPSATLVVRPPLAAHTPTRDVQVSITDRAHALIFVIIGWMQSLLMLAVRAWLKVGGHRPAASDPGMAPQATVAMGAGHGVPDPEVIRKRRLQTLADLKKEKDGEDGKGPVEAYNGNSTSHEQ